MSVVEGHIAVRGARFPLTELSAPSKIVVTESREEPPIIFEFTEVVRFGLSKTVSYDLTPNLSEAVKLGLTKHESDDLSSNLSETVTITNV